MLVKICLLLIFMDYKNLHVLIYVRCIFYLYKQVEVVRSRSSWTDYLSSSYYFYLFYHIMYKLFNIASRTNNPCLLQILSFTFLSRNPLPHFLISSIAKGKALAVASASDNNVNRINELCEEIFRKKQGSKSLKDYYSFVKGTIVCIKCF